MRYKIWDNFLDMGMDELYGEGRNLAENVPSGVAVADSYLVHSIINGATGGVNATSAIFHPKIWQER